MTAQQKTWDQRLREPFPDDQLEYKPADGKTCRACMNAPDKVCGRHEKRECPVCHKYMTTAHDHLTYVGHAGITQRLLDVDPDWSWEPAQRQVDPEILKAAVATGNPEIINTVIGNAPPLVVDYTMWITLTIHDGDGKPHTRPGFGDAQGKSGPNAMKEIIGDAIRNAAMRFGVATYLWGKSDEAREMGGGDRQIKRQPKPAGNGKAKPPDDSGNGQAEDAKNGAALALAKEAVKIASTSGTTVGDLQEKVRDKAQREHLLGVMVPDMFSGEKDRQMQLGVLLNRAKRYIENGGPGADHGGQ